MLSNSGLSKYVILILALAVVIVVLFFIKFSPQSLFAKSYHLNFRNPDTGNMFLNESLYDIQSYPGTFVYQISYPGLSGTASDFVIDKQNNFAVHHLVSDVVNHETYLSTVVMNKTIPETLYHKITFSSTFSFDFNLSFYENDMLQTYPHNVNYQNTLANHDFSDLLADRMMVCFNLTTKTHNVRYNYYDLRGNTPAFDTWCTIGFSDSRSFTNYCMYPHKCKEVNMLDYDKGITTVTYSDDSGKTFYTTSFAVTNSVLNYAKGDYLKFLIENQDFCNDISCQDFKAYIYDVSISAN
jgi:hypothetical protein